MLMTKRLITGTVPSFPLVAHQRVVHFIFFRIGESYKSPSSLTAVRAGFARSNRLYERNRFDLKATKN